MQDPSEISSKRLRLSRRDVLSWGVAGTLGAGLEPKRAAAADGQARKASINGPQFAQRLTAALAALDKNQLVELAVDLTNVPSPTGHEEAAARFLHDQMRREGIVAHLQTVAPGRCNVLGIHDGSGRGRSLMFVGHLDAYMPRDDDSMRNVPTAVVVEGKRICGNGIVNMKGSLAAYVAAVRAIHRSGIGLAGDVLIAAVAGSFQNSPVDEFQGEEYRGYGVGTKHLLANGGVADLCVVGEPTAFELVTQSFGVTCVRIDLTARVNRMHADDSANAAVAATQVIETVDAWAAGYRTKYTVSGVEPQVGVIAVQGGRPWTTDGTPPPLSCTVFVEVRTPPTMLPIAVKHEMDEVLKRARSRCPGFDVRAELYATNPGTSVSEDSPVVAAVRSAHSDVFGVPPKIATVGWHSDASHLNRYGIPAVNYGPPFGESPDGECLEIEDLVNCTRAYIGLILRVCADAI